MSAPLTHFEAGMHVDGAAGGAAARTPPASNRCHSPDASTTTLVSTRDMLHRYERLLVELTEQVLEQQEDIRALRAALHVAERADPRTRDAAQQPHHRRRHHKKLAEVGTPIDQRNTEDRPSKRRPHVREHHGQRSSGGGGDSATPHVSAILAVDGAELESVAGRSPASQGRLSGAATAAAAEQSHEVAAVVHLTEVCPLSPKSIASHVYDVSTSSSGEAAGLTPSPGAHAAAAVHTRDRAVAAASLAAAPPAETRASAGLRRRGAPSVDTTPPQAGVRDIDAMDFLLTVFSADKAQDARRSRTHDTARLAHDEGGAPEGGAPHRRRHVARELFRSADEGEASRTVPVSPAEGRHHRTLRTPDATPPVRVGSQRGGVEVEEAARWQERYARIVACALAAEAAAAAPSPTALNSAATATAVAEQRSSGSSPFTSQVSEAPAATTQSALSSRDLSASAQVAEPLRLFTPCKA